MGTQSSPNILLTLIDVADGLPETGLAVVIVPYGGDLGVDDIVLSEIGVTGKYKKSTANGVDAVDQGVYEVYADSGGGYEFRGTYLHGGDALEAHRISTADPHAVTAQQVSLTDVGGYFDGTELETALQEVGLAMGTIPDAQNALLLNASAQYVSALKPKVTGLNADKTDGYHAGNAANQLVVLDSYGKVPSRNLPTVDDPGDPGDPFYGNADTLDGLHQGQGSGKIPKWNSAGSHNDLDTSVAGKKVTGLTGHLVAMSGAAGTPVANKLHTTFLQKKFPVVGSLNNLIIQHGWRYVQGNDAQSVMDAARLFTNAFNTVPLAFIISPVGKRLVSSGAPTSLDDFGQGLKILSAHAFSITKSGFSINIYTDTGDTLESTYYWGYSFIAIGVKA